jgi:hypothetical protein
MFKQKNALALPPPLGDESSAESLGQNESFPLQTPGGVFHVRWDNSIETTAYGGIPGFIEFLNSAQLLDSWIDDCPLHYDSNNAPDKRSVLGTALLSVLAGHSRYAHVTSLRADGVNPRVLGMKKVVSEDSLRRAFSRLEEESARTWQQQHLVKTYLPLLARPWILDVDVTIKPLHGYQEGAVVSYNPHKPGRPCHAYHTYIMAGTRIVLDVEVTAGDEQSAAHTRPGLWHWLEKIPRSHWPHLLRGDCGFGSEHMMAWPENNGLHYLFKQRMTKKTRLLIDEVNLSGDWVPTAGGWEGTESTLRLSTWTRERRVVILRKLNKKRYKRVDGTNQDMEKEGTQNVISFEGFGEIVSRKDYDYQVLVTSRHEDIPFIAQLYRDRADAENVFDEMKNNWGWAGFTTQDISRSRIIAQIYNWWSIFVRIADPQKHHEAVTSRPLLKQSLARKTTTGGQSFLTITSTHGRKDKIARFFKNLARFLS